jgi:hypothetical protein
MVLLLRLRGGGGDGGVYPLTHAEQKWMTPSGMGTTGKAWSNHSKDRASEGTARLDRATACAATAKPLKAPIVVCDLGHLLNKEDVIELMLSKALPPHLLHIKSLRSLHDAKLHPNPAYRADAGKVAGTSEDDDEPPFCCPIASVPLNGRYPFVLVKPSGHVVSQRALKQVGASLCPVTEQPLGPDDTIPINPSDEERAAMQEEMAARKAAAAESKRKAKAAASAGGAGYAGAATAGGGEGAQAQAGSDVGGAPTRMSDAAVATKPSLGKGKAAAAASMPPPQGIPPAKAAAAASGSKPPGGSKRPRSEWESAVAQRVEGSSVYKSLFISAEDRKKQEQAEAANFCARGIVPSLSRSTKFGLG